MPAVVDNVRDVRGAADNVSVISIVGNWQFLLIVLVVASFSISFVFDFDSSAVPGLQSPISVDWRNEGSWRHNIRHIPKFRRPPGRELEPKRTY